MIRKYVLREYYIDNPSPELYYRDTREECEQLAKRLRDEDDDIEEIVISDEPDDVSFVSYGYNNLS